MSIFGFYFVGNLLREAGWPRKLGLFRGEGIATDITDAAIDQMVDWAASLDAGRPSLALQMIAEMFRDRDWDGENAPEIGVFIAGARKRWDETPNAAPREVLQPTRLRKAFGAAISTKDFKDRRVSVALEGNVRNALLWGLANPERFATWYADRGQHHQSSLKEMQSAGLDVDAPPILEEFFQLSESIVRDYERDIRPLPSIADKLLSDARAVGVKV
jgi:hypothetical protein